jgi:hypothetical protein
MKAVICLALALSLTGCTDADGARRALNADGFDTVEITGYRPFACGKDDGFRTGFRGCKGQKCATGVVCSGWLKGYTIRYD